ncbi:MBL fold metallo-hydrolase [Halogeometricum sp. S1BR25-6]|uniref:MBL fold metallo-hydrolase n=1 Tax=Halogeometricum salsisoli TaxID=2950536 RepID=A0ABU2GBZ1_9EURY|nr:MBL fold metallo-hydrolase [Halogeometricum sp. S1BR25-6]MDS0298331.1 MBL fold metallo-hydrolase [Halogeometricum sp. S1BR25-6]
MDLRRIRLGNTVFEGRNNAYLLPGEETTLVDVGASLDEIRADLDAGLAEADLDVTDVDQILLTHWHADHSGLAGELQAESGAVVRAHEADAPLVAGEESAVSAERDLRQRRFEEWGLPEAKRAELADYLDTHEDLAGDPADVVTMTDGDRIPAGDGELEVVHLPGHAAGLVAFAFDADGDGRQNGGREQAFVGDAILPKYTPNVGGADLRVERPLETYVDSLRTLVDRDLSRALPGHRDPIEDPSARARTILDHHRDRTRRVVDVLDEHGPLDAWTVSARLFGELENIHILHGPGEAWAHLDHLVHADVVERDDRAYRLVESDPDVSALFPE